MEWIRENWFWIVVFVLFFWLHGKMHGGHAGHGGRSGRGGGGGGGCGGHAHGRERRADEAETAGQEEEGRHAEH